VKWRSLSADLRRVILLLVVLVAGYIATSISVAM
jgi:hypothetical protein